jgi:adenine-specific DNA-methyltransferase
MTKVRMHDDLLQNGLRKKARKSDAMFVAIGEPDLNIHYSLDKKTIQVEVLGMDIFDPLKNESKARNKSDIAFFQVDDDYDGSRFIIRQIMFCGGDGKELDKLQKSVEALAKQRNNSKKALESTLKIVVDDDAFDRCYGFISHYIDVVEDKKLAIRIVTHFGEEVTKVITL